MPRRTQPIPLLDVLPDHLSGPDDVPRVIGRTEALARGFSPHAIEHRLRTRRWHRVLPHTYLTGSTLTWADRLAAALVFAGPDALLTGAAALADLGLRCVDRPDAVLILVPRTTHIRPAGWVRVRRTDRMPAVADVHGPRRATLGRAVADLALERRRLDDVRALVSQALRADLCQIGELWSELAAGPRRHSANLRRALLDADGGAWSAPEGRAAGVLRSPGIPAFEQNVPLDLPGLGTIVVDFYWRALRAVLEIDSDEHHWDDPVTRDTTVRRHSLLQTCGMTVMSRRPAAIAGNPQQFRRDVVAWLAARARELSAMTALAARPGAGGGGIHRLS